MRKDCETHLSNFLKQPVMRMQSVSLYQYTLLRINVYERNIAICTTLLFLDPHNLHALVIDVIGEV